MYVCMYIVVILTVLVISCAAETLSDYGTAEHKFFIIVHLFQVILLILLGICYSITPLFNNPCT